MQTRDAQVASAPCGPVVVHCSAGVGRTGSYIAIDIQLEKYACESRMDVFTAVSILRQFRCHLVQTAVQYVYVHKVLVDAISRSVCLSNADVCAYLTKLCRSTRAERRCVCDWACPIRSQPRDDRPSSLSLAPSRRCVVACFDCVM